jgi:hypothetical protein
MEMGTFENHLLQQPKNLIATFKNHLLQHPKNPIAIRRNSNGRGSRCRLLQPWPIIFELVGGRRE